MISLAHELFMSVATSFSFAPPHVRKWSTLDSSSSAVIFCADLFRCCHVSSTLRVQPNFVFPSVVGRSFPATVFLRLPVERQSPTLFAVPSPYPFAGPLHVLLLCDL